MAAKPETLVETVEMSDGRLVDFAGKRKLLKEQVGTDDDMTIRLDFRNGASRTIRIPEELAAKFAIHGALQKFGDEVAGVEDIDDQVLAVDDLADRIAKLEWNVKREAGGMSGTSTLLKALVELTKKTPEQIKVFLTNKSQAEKLALRNSEQLKPIVDKIEAEKAKKGSTVNTSALLAELDVPAEAEAE